MREATATWMRPPRLALKPEAIVPRRSLSKPD
jgi:hypothetical protein